MSADKFDKEIDTLYQQRKKSVQAPSIRFPVENVKPKRKFTEIIPIFAMGSLASFAIFAVIHHFAVLPPEQATINNDFITHVDIVELDNAKAADNAVNVPTPPKPQAKIQLAEPPKKVFDMSRNIAIAASESAGAIAVDHEHVEIVSLMPNESGVSHQPLYKVMPEYIHENGHQSGTVKLSYRVNKKGAVIHVEIVNSSVGRALEKSAKQALKQWKYHAGAEHKKQHFVEFQFK